MEEVLLAGQSVVDLRVLNVRHTTRVVDDTVDFLHRQSLASKKENKKRKHR